ncbi:hypothetical protein QN277_001344 [Acacia crassicarpa]|uniref:PUM-HD domain-containing protein n=1 Tax=Acacia crassicarpa TaxID=499986 RepID=A0AAE1TGP4_9FABA|nr:hypothetical protein QN277_001344 [Acacia crassicarpa]
MEKLTQPPRPTLPSLSTQPPLPPLPSLSTQPPLPPLPSPHLLTVKRVTNPENQNNTNDHDNPKRPTSQEDGSPSESSSFRSNDDFVIDELFENSTRQQTLAENPEIETSHVYEEARDGNTTTQQSRVGNSGINPSPFYNILPYFNTASNRPARVGNFGPIGPRRGHVRMLQNENNTNQQTLDGNSEFVPYRPLGNNTNEHPLFGNLVLAIEPSSVSNSSPLMRRRYDNLTSSLEVYEGRLVSMSKDEDGSKYLETILENKNPRDIGFILTEVRGDLHDLMKDIFGKNVIEKLFDVLYGYPLTLFFQLITMERLQFRHVCINNIGYKVVMSMIDHLTTEIQRDGLTFTLRQIAVPLATSQYGSDVLQHFLRIFPNDFFKDILPEIAFACEFIAKTRSGSSLIQKCLSVATTPDTIPACLILFDQVINRVLLLSTDPYGNYVVQYLIRMGLHERNDEIVNRLRGHYVEFSTNQHASNVVERLLQFSSPTNVEIIVQEIWNSSAFLSVLQDPYGNYVAQTALQFYQGDMREILLNKILHYEQILYTDRYGRKVLDFLNRKVLDFLNRGRTFLPRF